MICIWKGDVRTVIGIIELETILENLHTWAARTLRPWISHYIDQWKHHLRLDPRDSDAQQPMAVEDEGQGRDNSLILRSEHDSAPEAKQDMGDGDFEENDRIRNIFRAENQLLLGKMESLLISRQTAAPPLWNPVIRLPMESKSTQTDEEPSLGGRQVSKSPNVVGSSPGQIEKQSSPNRPILVTGVNSGMAAEKTSCCTRPDWSRWEAPDFRLLSESGGMATEGGNVSAPRGTSPHLSILPKPSHVGAGSASPHTPQKATPSIFRQSKLLRSIKLGINVKVKLPNTQAQSCSALLESLHHLNSSARLGTLGEFTKKKLQMDTISRIHEARVTLKYQSPQLSNANELLMELTHLENTLVKLSRIRSPQPITMDEPLEELTFLEETLSRLYEEGKTLQGRNLASRPFMELAKSHSSSEIEATTGCSSVRKTSGPGLFGGLSGSGPRSNRGSGEESTPTLFSGLDNQPKSQIFSEGSSETSAKPKEIYSRTKTDHPTENKLSNQGSDEPGKGGMFRFFSHACHGEQHGSRIGNPSESNKSRLEFLPKADAFVPPGSGVLAKLEASRGVNSSASTKNCRFCNLDSGEQKGHGVPSIAGTNGPVNSENTNPSDSESKDLQLLPVSLKAVEGRKSETGNTWDSFKFDFSTSARVESLPRAMRAKRGRWLDKNDFWFGQTEGPRAGQSVSPNEEDEWETTDEELFAAQD